MIKSTCWARSSPVERFIDIEEVDGPIPSGPTMYQKDILPIQPIVEAKRSLRLKITSSFEAVRSGLALLDPREWKRTDEIIKQINHWGE